MRERKKRRETDTVTETDGETERREREMKRLLAFGIELVRDSTPSSQLCGVTGALGEKKSWAW